jgi:hypothetical protein
VRPVGDLRRRHFAPAVASVVWPAVVVVVGAVVLGACSRSTTFDRDGAVDAVVAQGNGRITRPQAECYVDRVHDEVGTAPFEPGYKPPNDLVPKLADIRIDCVGVANIGTAPPATVDPDLSLREALPNHRGDDPALDALYDGCAAGDGTACDQLFDQAPVGSDYELFASTCGGRRAELRCGPEPTTTTSVTPLPGDPPAASAPPAPP